jgi:hypothetical protein
MWRASPPIVHPSIIIIIIFIIIIIIGFEGASGGTQVRVGARGVCGAVWVQLVRAGRAG